MLHQLSFYFYITEKPYRKNTSIKDMAFRKYWFQLSISRNVITNFLLLWQINMLMSNQ